MALEKNKVHHIFFPADTSVETWKEDLRNSLYAILIEEGWTKKEGEDFYSYPKDNLIKIRIDYSARDNFCFMIRSYSSTGAYVEQESDYLSPKTGTQEGLFLNYIVNSKGEVGIGLSSFGKDEYPYKDNFYFLIGLDKKNNAGIFTFPHRDDETIYCFMSLGEGIKSDSSHSARLLDIITPYPHTYTNTILYNCINYISGENFENIYGFYSAPYSEEALCESVLYIENAYYKGIGNMRYNNWTSYDKFGNPKSLTFRKGSAPKCLKLV